MSGMLYEVTETATATPGSEILFARGVNPNQERHCPHCGAVVYSRRHKVCGVCCERLPDGCLFSDNQAASVQALLREERQRHRAWLNKVNFAL